MHIAAASTTAIQYPFQRIIPCCMSSQNVSLGPIRFLHVNMSPTSNDKVITSLVPAVAILYSEARCARGTGTIGFCDAGARLLPAGREKCKVSLRADASSREHRPHKIFPLPDPVRFCKHGSQSRKVVRQLQVNFLCAHMQVIPTAATLFMFVCTTRKRGRLHHLRHPPSRQAPGWPEVCDALRIRRLLR